MTSLRETPRSVDEGGRSRTAPAHGALSGMPVYRIRVLPVRKPAAARLGPSCAPSAGLDTLKPMAEPTLKDVLRAISEVKSDLTSVKSDVNSVKSDLTSVKSDLTSVKSNLAKLEANVGARFDAVDTRFDRVDEQLADLDRDLTGQWPSTARSRRTSRRSSAGRRGQRREPPDDRGRARSIGSTSPRASG